MGKLQLPTFSIADFRRSRDDTQNEPPPDFQVQRLPLIMTFEQARQALQQITHLQIELSDFLTRVEKSLDEV